MHEVGPPHPVPAQPGGVAVRSGESLNVERFGEWYPWLHRTTVWVAVKVKTCGGISVRSPSTTSLVRKARLGAKTFTTRWSLREVRQWAPQEAGAGFRADHLRVWHLPVPVEGAKLASQEDVDLGKVRKSQLATRMPDAERGSAGAPGAHPYSERANSFCRRRTPSSSGSSPSA